MTPSEIADRLRAAAAESAEHYADGYGDGADASPAFVAASRKASDLERLMRLAADRLDEQEGLLEWAHELIKQGPPQ